MRENISLTIFVKSIDAGTGSLVFSLQKLAKDKNIHIKTLVLEKPSYRKKDNTFQYLHNKKYYPYRYNINISAIRDFIRECAWYKNKLDVMKPDIILSMDVHCNIISSIVKLMTRSNSKLVLVTNINLKATIEEKSTSHLSKTLQKTVSFLYNKADVLVCSAKEMRESLRLDFGVKKKITLIHYGIPKNVVKRRRRVDKKKIIMSVGRLVEQKDFITLINAFDKVSKKFRDCILVIIGEGPMRNELVIHIKRKGLASKVRLLGWKKNTSVWIAQSDIFVLSSKREGFPYVLLEALNEGKPIISTDAPFGPREMLDGGKYGILIPVGDELNLAKAMLLLLKNKNERKRYERCAKDRSAYYSEAKMLSQYLEIIHRRRL